MWQTQHEGVRWLERTMSDSMYTCKGPLSFPKNTVLASNPCNKITEELDIQRNSIYLGSGFLNFNPRICSFGTLGRGV